MGQRLSARCCRAATDAAALTTWATSRFRPSGLPVARDVAARGESTSARRASAGARSWFHHRPVAIGSESRGAMWSASAACSRASSSAPYCSLRSGRSSQTQLSKRGQDFAVVTHRLASLSASVCLLAAFSRPAGRTPSRAACRGHVSAGEARASAGERGPAPASAAGSGSRRQAGSAYRGGLGPVFSLRVRNDARTGELEVNLGLMVSANYEPAVSELNGEWRDSPNRDLKAAWYETKSLASAEIVA